MDFRTFGIGAQILRALGVRRMRVLGAPKQMHALSGFGLEVVEYVRRVTRTRNARMDDRIKSSKAISTRAGCASASSRRASTTSSSIGCSTPPSIR